MYGSIDSTNQRYNHQFDHQQYFENIDNFDYYQQNDCSSQYFVNSFLNDLNNLNYMDNNNNNNINYNNINNFNNANPQQRFDSTSDLTTTLFKPIEAVDYSPPPTPDIITTFAHMIPQESTYTTPTPTTPTTPQQQQPQQPQQPPPSYHQSISSSSQSPPQYYSEQIQSPSASSTFSISSPSSSSLSSTPSISSTSTSTISTLPTLNSPLTVDETKKHLIKESLRFKIQNRRVALGLDELSANELSSPSGRESIESQQQQQQQSHLTREDEERRRRRKERNKVAAAKCRNKKKLHSVNLMSEYESLESSKAMYKKEIFLLEKEIQQLTMVLKSHQNQCQAKHLCKKKLIEMNDMDNVSQFY